MAHKEAGGPTRSGCDSEAKRPGVKRSGGEAILVGNIIIRQRGTKLHVGTSAGCDRDHTLLVLTNGEIKFEVKGLRNRKLINIAAE